MRKQIRKPEYTHDLCSCGRSKRKCSRQCLACRNKTPKQKRCTGPCGRMLSIDSFRLRSVNTTARRSYCQECEGAEWRRRYASLTREERRARSQRLRLNGFPPSVIRAFFDLQPKQCAICGATVGDVDGRRLYIEHNHVTHRLRGLLCKKCNAGIGMFGDDVTRLEAAIAYLKRTDGQSLIRRRIQTQV